MANRWIHVWSVGILLLASSASAGNPPIQVNLTMTHGGGFHVKHLVNVATGTTQLILSNSGTSTTEVVLYGMIGSVLSNSSPTEYTLTLTQTPGTSSAIDAAVERCAALASQVAALKSVPSNVQLNIQITAAPGYEFYQVALPTALSLNLSKSTISALQCSL